MLRILAVLVLSLSGTPQFALAQTTDIPKGIFMLSPADKPPPSALLGKPYVDGVVLRLRWRTLEPEPGVFEWRVADRMFASTEGFKKPVSLVVSMGAIAQPDWLTNSIPEHEYLELIDDNPYHAGAGSMLRLPLYWSQTLLEHKRRLMTAVASRYGDHSMLSIISAQCGNSATDDWNIPFRSFNQQMREKLIAGAHLLTKSCVDQLNWTAQLFPEQWIKIAVGSVPRALGSTQDFLSQLIRQGSGIYTDRLILQRHNLSTGTPHSSSSSRNPSWQAFGEMEIPKAGQFLWPASDIKSCRLAKRGFSCDPQEMFRETVRLGKSYGMHYLEVYATDLRNRQLRDDLLNAHIDLTGSVQKITKNRSTTNNPRAKRPKRRGAETSIEEWEWVNPPGRFLSSIEGVSHHTLPSAMMGRDVGYSIYVPNEYSSNAEQCETFSDGPVLYWLHGRNGNESGGLRHLDLLKNLLISHNLGSTKIVFVNGGTRGFYSNSKDGRFPIESMFVEELIPLVEKQLCVRASRKNRWLHGFSMGGFGALKIAAKYPTLFSAVVSYGGAILDREFPISRADRWANEDIFDSDLEYFVENTPNFWFNKNRSEIARLGLSVSIVVGSDDPTKKFNDLFVQKLSALGIDHEYTILPKVRHVPRQYYSTQPDVGILPLVIASDSE